MGFLQEDVQVGFPKAQTPCFKCRARLTVDGCGVLLCQEGIDKQATISGLLSRSLSSYSLVVLRLCSDVLILCSNLMILCGDLMILCRDLMILCSDLMILCSELMILCRCMCTFPAPVWAYDQIECMDEQNYS